MAGQKKPRARDAFNDNMADAEALLALARALRNKRVRQMRTELRERVGDALRVPKKKRVELDGIESDDFFIVIKPGASVTRQHLSETQGLRPLLRQAIVAACAAVETFCADRVMERLGVVLRQPKCPDRLADVALTVGDWLAVTKKYERQQWGLRLLLEEEARQFSSAAPSKIGQLFSWIEEKDLWKRIDARRKASKGASAKEMERIYERRNRIAHQGDRVKRSRAAITIEEVADDLALIQEIVEALDAETKPK